MAQPTGSEGAENRHMEWSEDEDSGSELDPERICRICLEGPNDGGLPEPLLDSPCGCSGSARYVHEACLASWRFTAVDNERALMCTQCTTRYRLEPIHPLLVWAHNSTILQALLSLTSLAFASLLLGALLVPMGPWLSSQVDASASSVRSQAPHVYNASQDAPWKITLDEKVPRALITLDPSAIPYIHDDSLFSHRHNHIDRLPARFFLSKKLLRARAEALLLVSETKTHDPRWTVSAATPLTATPPPPDWTFQSQRGHELEASIIRMSPNASEARSSLVKNVELDFLYASTIDRRNATAVVVTMSMLEAVLHEVGLSSLRVREIVRPKWNETQLLKLNLSMEDVSMALLDVPVRSRAWYFRLLERLGLGGSPEIFMAEELQALPSESLVHPPSAIWRPISIEYTWAPPTTTYLNDTVAAPSEPPHRRGHQTKMYTVSNAPPTWTDRAKDVMSVLAFIILPPPIWPVRWIIARMWRSACYASSLLQVALNPRISGPEVLWLSSRVLNQASQAVLVERCGLIKSAAVLSPAWKVTACRIASETLPVLSVVIFGPHWQNWWGGFPVGVYTGTPSAIKIIASAIWSEYLPGLRVIDALASLYSAWRVDWQDIFKGSLEEAAASPPREPYERNSSLSSWREERSWIPDGSPWLGYERLLRALAGKEDGTSQTAFDIYESYHPSPVPYHVDSFAWVRIAASRTTSLHARLELYFYLGTLALVAFAFAYTAYHVIHGHARLAYGACRRLAKETLALGKVLSRYDVRQAFRRARRHLWRVATKKRWSTTVHEAETVRLDGSVTGEAWESWEEEDEARIEALVGSEGIHRDAIPHLEQELQANEGPPAEVPPPQRLQPPPPPQPMYRRIFRAVEDEVRRPRGAAVPRTMAMLLPMVQAIFILHHIRNQLSGFLELTCIAAPVLPIILAYTFLEKLSAARAKTRKVIGKKRRRSRRRAGTVR